MSTHEPQRMSHSQAYNLIAVFLWIAAIVLFAAAAWSGNGWAGVTGVLFTIGGALLSHKADFPS